MKLTELCAYFLIGPTAVGKTGVAHWIARQEGFDIISADSMLVYEGMDIGTAKPDARMRSEVRYYCIDLVTPDKPFSVYDFREAALSALQDIAAADRRAIVVGGSGLYIKALTDGLADVPGASADARQYWTAVFEREGVAALQEALNEKNPDLMRSLSDQRNPRRLIRALEMAGQVRGELPSGWQQVEAGAPLAGLRMPPEQLQTRIASRVLEMYAAGLVDEVRNLLERYPDLSSTALQAIGYSEALALIQGKVGRKDAVAKTTVRTRQLAKRQRTWFRHQADVGWLDIDNDMGIESVAPLVMGHWRENGPTRIRGRQ